MATPLARREKIVAIAREIAAHAPLAETAAVTEERIAEPARRIVDLVIVATGVAIAEKIVIVAREIAEVAVEADAMEWVEWITGAGAQAALVAMDVMAFPTQGRCLIAVAYAMDQASKAVVAAMARPIAVEFAEDQGIKVAAVETQRTKAAAVETQRIKVAAAATARVATVVMESPIPEPPIRVVDVETRQRMYAAYVADRVPPIPAAVSIVEFAPIEFPETYGLPSCATESFHPPTITGSSEYEEKQLSI